jgi:hypothetical protein
MVHLPSVVARLGETGTAAPDAAASKVTITLVNYRPAAAGALLAAYGEDWISVVPSSARYVPLGGSAR